MAVAHGPQEVVMSSVRARRAATLAIALTVALSGTAAADTITADGDAVSAGPQPSVHLGDVAPGEAVSVEVAFELACQGASRVTAGSQIVVTVFDQTVPADGAAVPSQDGTLDVPADWPAPGEDCPAAGRSVASVAPAVIDLVAPTVAGDGQEYVFLLLADPGTGVTNTIAFTATLDVVEPDPVDTTPPSLAGLPADITAWTTGTTAVVTWPAPTASDDTDPDPVVTCSPTSGSTFDLGTTTVTCTATDASGNAARGSFAVTVLQVPPAPDGRFGSPLDAGSVPALVGQLGRTIPLKLLDLDGTDAPSLTAERLGT